MCDYVGNSLILAAAFKNGDVMMLRSYDDVIPHLIHTGMNNVVMDWSNSGAWLAVGGKVITFNISYKQSACFVLRI